jgi:hypothetical protein
MGTFSQDGMRCREICDLVSMGKILKPETIWSVIREEGFALWVVKISGVLVCI